MLKGQCEITLTNSDGSIAFHTIEENMITNAVNNILNIPNWITINSDNTEMLYGSCINNLTPIANKLLGGVLLFEDQIEENPDTIYPPMRNKQVGYAGNLTYSGENKLLGSYNSLESNFTPDEAKLVFDFNTSQANGTIRCICLTSAQGGLCGWDSNTNSAHHRFIRPYHKFMSDGINDTLTILTNLNSGFSNIIWMGGNKFMGINVVSGEITLSEFELIDKLGLQTKPSKPVFVNTNIKITNTLDPNRSPFSSKDFVLCCYWDYRTNLLHYTKILTTTKELIERQIDLSVADISEISTNPNAGLANWAEHNGFLYLVWNYQKDFKVLKINTDTLEKTIFVLPKGAKGAVDFSILNNEIFIKSSTGDGFLIDNILRPVDTGISLNNFIIECDSIKPLVLHKYSNNLMLGIISPYLGSINNQTVPIVKNNTQTMKLVYTITQ